MKRAVLTPQSCRLMAEFQALRGQRGLLGCPVP